MIKTFFSIYDCKKIEMNVFHWHINYYFENVATYLFI